jgi:hypothetical protein
VYGSDESLLIMELGVNEKVPTMRIVADKINADYKTMIIRVPFYNPKNFINSDKMKPDEREI